LVKHLIKEIRDKPVAFPESPGELKFYTLDQQPAEQEIILTRNTENIPSTVKILDEESHIEFDANNERSYDDSISYNNNLLTYSPIKKLATGHPQTFGDSANIIIKFDFQNEIKESDESCEEDLNTRGDSSTHNAVEHRLKKKKVNIPILRKNTLQREPLLKKFAQNPWYPDKNHHK